jgi:hypothetical protein
MLMILETWLSREPRVRHGGLFARNFRASPAMLRLALSILALQSLLAPAEARAQIPGCITVAATIFASGPETSNGYIFSQRLLRIRLGTREILGALETQLGMTFPRGACIQVTAMEAPTPDVVRVVDARGEVVVPDVSAFVRVDAAPELEISSGTFNERTSAESGVFLFPVILAINIPTSGVDVQVRGVAFETFSAGPEQANGLQRVSSRTTAKVIGHGLLLGHHPVFVEGTVTHSGRGEFDID